MSAFKKLLPGKKKAKKSSSASLRSATSEPNVADGFPETGYRNVKEKDLPKLHKAAWNGDLAKVKQLMKKADVNQMDKHHRTALHYACVRGSKDITELLCTSRAKLGICDADGRTALMKAVESASQDCVEVLLNHGAETNVVDVSLSTPLHLTATHGSIPMATMLLERDARVNAADIEKITPLHVASSLGFPEFVDFLLKEYALVNEADAYGRTPLIAAAMEGHIAIVKMLLEYGSDIEIKDNEGWKAADHAAMAGHHSIANMIEEATKDEEPQAAQPDFASNFGSGTGSPFKSSSTQPVSSIFGGPAININVDSEDESTGQESPTKPEFQHSWADSDSEIEDEPKKVPSLVNALSRNESIQSTKSASRIPVVSPSKEKLKTAPKDGSTTSPENAKVAASASNSKIPRFDSGKIQQSSTSPPDKSSRIPSPSKKHESKIPMAKGKSASSTSLENNQTKSAKPLLSGHESKIPRLSNSPLPSRKDVTLETGGNLAAKDSKKSFENHALQDEDNNDFENSDLSAWDSESEDFSETDVLAALSGSPQRKKPEDSKQKINLKDRFNLFQASKSQSKAGKMEHEPESESPTEPEQHPDNKSVENDVEKSKEGENEVEERLNEDTHVDKKQNDDELNGEDGKPESELNSTAEEPSAPKPVLTENMEKTDGNVEEKEDIHAQKNGDLDLDVGWDSSEATSMISPPEMANKSKQNAEVKSPAKNPESPTKDNPESEFSDFSIQEYENTNHVSQDGSKKTDEEKNAAEKAKQDRKAQLSALGLDLGSSFSSFSDNDEFGELDTSMTRHDALFPSNETPKLKNEDSNSKNESRPGGSEEAGLKDTIDSGLGRTTENQNDVKDNNTPAVKSTAKAQYDALGLALSENEDSITVTESESEWETSLKKKKEDTKIEDPKEKETDMQEELAEDKGNEIAENKVKKMMTELMEDTTNESESEMVIKDAVEVNKGENVNVDAEEAGQKNIKDSEVRDSEFISDENFSVNTEDQLEELESERLKAIGQQQESSKSSGDFDDSDFSYVESNKVDDSADEGSQMDRESEKVSQRQSQLEESENESQIRDQSEESEEAGNEANAEESASESQNEAHAKESKNDIESSLHEVEEDIVNTKDEVVNEQAPFKTNSKTQQEDERFKILQSMADSTTINDGNVRNVTTSGTFDRKYSAERKISDDVERKQKLEAMVKPMPFQQIVQPVVQAAPEVKEEHDSLSVQEEDLSIALEEEFERKMLEKEEESKADARRNEEELKRIEEEQQKMENDRRRKDEDDRKRKEEEEAYKRNKDEEKERLKREEQRINEEEERQAKEEAFERELKLKEEEKQQEMEAKAKHAFEMEKQRIQRETEAQMKQHEDEMRERERFFEEELIKRELEDKIKREQRLAEREKEIEEIKTKQIKGIEDEFSRIQEEKLIWQKKRDEQAEKIRKEKQELAELSRKRKEEEKKAIEASMRLKEQELLWQQQQAEIRTDPTADLRKRELEELMRIEGLLKESSRREEERKLKEHIIPEDMILPKNTINDRAERSLEDVITPVRGSNEFATNDTGLDFTKKSLVDEGTQKRLNQSKQMREEAELLLQAARDKTNAIMTGQRYTNPPLPFSKMATYSAEADHGNETIDENFNRIPSTANMDANNKPRSDLVDFEMKNELETGFPTTSSPYELLKHNLDPRFAGNEDLSPVTRPKSAPGLREDGSYKTTTPMALYASLSQAGHFQDSKALMKMQDSLREAKRELERTKSRNVALESSKREMEVDVREMQRAVELLSKSQTDFERFRLEAEMELREAKYRLEQELEAKASTGGINSQLKEQLKRAEERLASEAEARQTIELAYKTMEAEFKIRENILNQQENDINDLRFSFNHEREARINQEKMYTEQLEQHEALLEEAQHTSFQHAQTVGQLEAVDQNRKSAEAIADSLKVEFAKTKGELVRVNAQLEETKSSYENEVSRLRQKLQEKNDALVTSERENFQAQMQMEAEKSTAKANQTRLGSSLDNEVANRKRIETELSVVKTQLQNANNELERLNKTKSLTETEVNRFKEETFKDKNKHDRELTTVKEELQRATVKLENTERRCDTIDAELQGANIALAEKSGQLVMANREMDYKNNILNQLEEKVRSEKELNQRLATKIEAQNDRAAILQREIDNLRRELDSANQRTVAYDKSARDSQEKFKALIANAKEDFEKERINVESRLERSNEAALRYKDELAEAKDDIKKKDFDLRQIEKEMNDLSRKLSAVEASNEILMKTREQFEDDRARLSRECAVLERSVSELQTQKNELLNKADDLTEQLEHTLKVSDHTNNKLAQKTADAHAYKQTRAEMEKSMTRLKVEKAELESELREERAQYEMVLDDLRKSNEARESLEKLIANVKTSNMHLEEKLQSETLSRAQRERDADEHKDLWNSEVKSRSKLGLKLVQMEKEVSNLKSELDEERRKKIQAEDGKKGVESKMELYEKRALQHQKETSAIRNKLKQYQRRLKDHENGESKLPKAYAEFERERDLMLNNTSNLRRQIDNVNEQLRQEQEHRSRAEISAKQNQHELNELKTREKILSYEREKLQKENQMLEDEMERLKSYFERNFVDKNNIGVLKKDIETKARLELNRKLQEVNIQLKEQAVARENYDRVRNENESKSKKELENTINSLRGELSIVKAAVQEGITKKNTFETEASRLKTLYQTEVADKHRLADHVSKLNDRFADTTARLSLEKSRNQQLLDLSSSLRVSPLKGSTVLSGEREDFLRTSALHDVDVKPMVHRDVENFISPVPRTNTMLRRNFLS